MIWLLALVGCVLGRYRDDQLCDDIGSAYASRVYACTGDGDAANAAYHELLRAFPCRVERVAFEPAPATAYSVPDGSEVAVVHTADEAIPLELAYECVPAVGEVDCALVDDLAAAWADIVSAEPMCGRLLGEGGVPPTATPYAAVGGGGGREGG